MQGPGIQSRMLARMVASMRTFARDDRGGTAIEYSLMLALIAMACLIAFQSLGDAQTGSWGNTANKASNAMNK